MVPAILRRDWTPVQWFGWRVLCDTWRHYGFVPGPGLPPPVEGVPLKGSNPASQVSQSSMPADVGAGVIP